MIETPIFNHSIRISAAYIDEMGQVNNTVYLQWVQDAVVKYWKQVSPPHVRADCFGVALQHEITYRMPHFLGDTVAALVTATGTRGSRASFTTVIKRGDEVAAEVPQFVVLCGRINSETASDREDIARVFLPQHRAEAVLEGNRHSV